MVEENMTQEENDGAKYTSLNTTEEYFASRNQNGAVQIETLDTLDRQISVDLMALVRNKDPTQHQDIENQSQQYSALPNNTICDESKETCEDSSEQWATLGASYVFVHKLLLVIYSAFIVLTIYNTVDIARNRHEAS